ncbi:MAG: hypothetical protein M3478_08080, partial [Planctomycetota bacterium]|nr:hypothetical protein [Planctomycetota bacterium]
KSTAPGGLNDNAMFVVVSTADPSAARSEVTSYLQSNKISWDSVSRPTPELDVMQNQAVNLSRSQQVNVRMKGGEGQQSQQLQQGELAQTQDKKFEGRSAAGAAGAPTASGTGAGAGTAQDSLASQSAQNPATDDQEQRRAESPAQAPAASSGAQPGVADAKESIPQPAQIMTNAVEPNEGLLQATTQPVTQQVEQQKQLRVVGQPTTESRLIIARGMTKQQAVELRGNLSKQTTVQRAAVYEPRPMAVANRSRETSPSGGGAATTQPSPTTEPLPVYQELAAAPTSSPAAPEDAGGWRDASPASPASPQSVNAAATTQDAAAALETTTAPSPSSLESTGALTLAVPGTMPSDGATDERVDVVILVEDDAPLGVAPELMEEPAAPALAPTTPNAAPTTAPVDPDVAPATQPAPIADPAP